NIHPTAVVDSAAELDSSVQVGPCAVVEKGVRIGADTVIGPHAVISGPTTIGVGNTISPFANIGAPPQDINYKGEDTRLEIGDHNIIREYVSLHRGSATGRGITTIGNNNMLMAYVHVAHDCQVGNHVILANAANLAGHVVVGDRATLSGMVAVHQFSKIGVYAYVGGMSGISKDVPPYVVVSGIRNGMRVTGINKVGLKRAGFDGETLQNLNRAFKILFRDNDMVLQDALVKVETDFAGCEPALEMVRFFRESKRGVVRTAAGDDEL
ncbi:MAG: acyl-ACP--UDP-N-acetylglucosamine O-acyltransferase, partial [Desulfobulbaceae bacterium]|nr:acyl-ACP--UDP-N-acetylglucosamine O-acyltransferase [Desulfobulbaceae bacterium]